jgi:hypothetical protein
VKRYKQTYDEIAETLQVLEVDWMADPHAETVISQLKALPTDVPVTAEDVIRMLKADFRAGSTVLRLILGMAKDEYDRVIPALFEGKGAGKKVQFQADPEAYLATFENLGLLEKINAEIHRPFIGTTGWWACSKEAGEAPARVSCAEGCWRISSKTSC